LRISDSPDDESALVRVSASADPRGFMLYDPDSETCRERIKEKQLPEWMEERHWLRGYIVVRELASASNEQGRVAAYFLPRSSWLPLIQRSERTAGPSWSEIGAHATAQMVGTISLDAEWQGWQNGVQKFEGALRHAGCLDSGSNSLSKAVSKTWEDEAVRAARSRRWYCEVKPEGAPDSPENWTRYSSTKQVWVDLLGDDGRQRHIKFRGGLVRAGQLREHGYDWRVVPANAVPEPDTSDTDTALSDDEPLNAIEHVEADGSLTDIEKESVRKERIGHAKWAKDVKARAGNRCQLQPTLTRNLVAGHIKPWALCEDGEHLDRANGLCLSPNLDKLFEDGLIGFSDEGVLLLGGLQHGELAAYGLSQPLQVEAAAGQVNYLRWHREHRLKPSPA